MDLFEICVANEAGELRDVSEQHNKRWMTILRMATVAAVTTTIRAREIGITDPAGRSGDGGEDDGDRLRSLSSSLGIRSWSVKQNQLKRTGRNLRTIGRR